MLDIFSKVKVPPKLLARWAEHTSEREQVAAEAERGRVEIKKFRLMEAQLDSRQIIDYDAASSSCRSGPAAAARSSAGAS